MLSNRALDRADRLETQGRADEARVEADLAAALDRTSVDAQLERASLLQQLGRPATHAAPSTMRSRWRRRTTAAWLTLAGYQR